ncbi:MAG: glycosyltransferase [Sphingobacteriales bacterium]|nr:glycosyltransferase [Sphingobacteriales bacterium]
MIFFIYSLSLLHLTRHFIRSTASVSSPPLLPDLPHITIQLPIYNEGALATRLLQHIAAFDYPKEKLHIQILDDSTDIFTTALCTQQAAQLLQRGFCAEHLHRPHREGFKAGALRAALPAAQGELIAIFDADFIPAPDWLLRCVPYFQQYPQLGMLQTRWSHLNGSASWLTRVFAFALDAHFTLEQSGRQEAGHFINFNGTAGMWRKSCIVAAGNWSSDTLAEDLDLSYRAQLQGWQMRYVPDIQVAAELPANWSALRSQQFRWNKGGAENFVKLLPSLWKNKQVSWQNKIQGTLHLGGSTLFAVLGCSQYAIFCWYF